MQMLNRLQPLIREGEADALRFLEALVRVNSYTDNPMGGQRVGEMIAERLSRLSGVAGVQAVQSERFAPHLVISTQAALESAEGAIGIVGHLDTVFPPATFETFTEDGPLLRGPGVLDMKGGLVIAIEALRALAREGVLASIPIRFVIVSDEEVGSPEGRDVIRKALSGAKAALVLEGGRAHDAVITARKGTGTGFVLSEGRAAHAGAAHAAGANAIWALCRFVDRAQALTDYGTGVTVNVGTIKGGTTKNTVPDRAEAGLDFRYVREGDGEALVASLQRIAEEVSQSVAGTRVSFRMTSGRPPLPRSEANLELYRAYAACARESGLEDGEAALVGGGSDASTTAAIGIASIDGLGPRGQGFHTHDERIERASLVPKTEALARFLLREVASLR